MSTVNKKTLAENYRNLYKKQIAVLEMSPLAEHRGVTDRDIVALGKQLDAVNSWKNYFNESIAQGGGFASDLGQLPKKALDIVTAAYGTSVIPELCSVQPIEEEQGIVWFKKIVAKTDRGNIVEGDELFHSQLMPEKYPNGYAAALTQVDNKAVFIAIGKAGSVDGEFPTDVFGQGATVAKLTFNVAASKTTSVRPHAVRLSLQEGEVVGGAFSVNTTRTDVLVDDGKGNLMGREMGGVVNYSTGEVTINFYGDLGTAILAGPTKFRMILSYETNFEESGNEAIGKIQYELESKNIRAQVFALTEQMGVLKSYSMQKRFGKDPQDEMVNDLVNSMTMDIGGAVLTDLINGCRGFIPRGKTAADYSNKVTYNMKSYQAPILAVQTLGMKVNEATQKIYEQSGRGEGNIICAAPEACWHFQSQPDFKPSGISIQGPHVFGTLGNLTIIRVPTRVPGFSNPRTCMVVYKGTGDFDAPAVYSPYLPLYVSGSIPMLNNPMMKQGICAAWVGISTTAPQFLTEIEFSNSFGADEPFPPYTKI